MHVPASRSSAEGQATVSLTASVLVCDSELESIRALKSVLRSAGFGVSIAATAKDALASAALRAPDAAIVEMELIDSTGQALCRRLREWSEMPVIVLSHTSDENSVVDALQAGADDYVTKPFRPAELVARLEAHLRWTRRGDGPPEMLWDGMLVDFAARVVRCDGGREIRLTPIEYKLICVLMRNRGRLLTHGALLRDVWGAAYAEDRQTLRVHIANLRRKLAVTSTRGPIRTYAGVGYLLEDARTYATQGTRRRRSATELSVVGQS